MGLSRHRTILVVEDDLDVRESIADALLETGHTVVQAVEGEDALAKLDQVGRPCLILLDVLMPGMGGLEFLDRLRDHPHARDFSVLVVSADSRPLGVESRPGVVGILRKPFDLDELLAWANATRDPLAS